MTKKNQDAALCSLLIQKLKEERHRNPQETKRTALRLALMAAIREGKVKPGERLPSESELARSLELSLGTVQSALGQLQDLGLIVRRRGDGTRIADAEPLGPNIWHFRFRVAATNRPLRLTEVKVEVLRTNERGPWSEHLGPGPYVVIRRRLTGDNINLGAEMYLPQRLINIDDIELSELEGVNLRICLEAFLGQRSHQANTLIAINHLSLRHAALFEMRPDNATFCVTACTSLGDGSPFYYQDIYAPSDLLILEI